ncbi:chaperone protein dnaJ 11, chloroplastic-like [Phoenix dactylifera]|uniref:Chaperone protein dnaJ 11, chloroplastic-like n=1 Tax=Phoenix dactylifera TaxID=42345 RepID=A0A8B7CY66_PHODC|nr:chaperone protein dnaJ 11, chloroplastic-like [Phoenix dactylifera]
MITPPSLACSQFLGARIPTPFFSPISKLRSSPRCAALHAPAMAADTGTLYDVLGLTARATGGDIKAAYRRLARACHPDVVGADRKGASADEFKRIHAAYATLSDPEKRADYDRRLAAATAIGRQQWSPRGPRPFSSSASSPSAATSFSGFARRTWETDQCW